MRDAMIENIRTALRRELKRDGRAQKTISKAAGLGESAIRDLLRKVGDPKLSTILQLADSLGVPPGNLFADLVPVVADAGHFGTVTFRPETAEPEMVPRPPMQDGQLAAMTIAGDTLRPAHRDGDVLYFQRREGVISLEGLGHECVVQLLDGGAFLRLLTHGSQPHLWTLRAQNEAPLETDVKLAWAAPILFTTRGVGQKINEGSGS